MTDTEKDTLCARIDELCAEVERLRLEAAEICKERDFFYQQDNENGERAQRAINAMNAENAKLRELVRTIYMCSDIRCNQCEYLHGDSCDFDAEAELRELGIEVDG